MAIGRPVANQGRAVVRWGKAREFVGPLPYGRGSKEARP